MKPIYYVIFAINGFTVLIWICILIRLFVIKISGRNNRFYDGMFEPRYTVKLKSESFSVSKDGIKENNTSKSKGEGFKDDRSD